MIEEMTEFSVNCPHEPGGMAPILETLAKGGVNVLALMGYGTAAEKGTVFLIPDKVDLTREKLKEAGISFETSEAITVSGPSGIGQGAKIVRAPVVQGINMEHCYASTSGTGNSLFVIRATAIDEIQKNFIKTTLMSRRLD